MGEGPLSKQHHLGNQVQHGKTSLAPCVQTSISEGILQATEIVSQDHRRYLVELVALGIQFAGTVLGHPETSVVKPVRDISIAFYSSIAQNGTWAASSYWLAVTSGILGW